MTRRGGVKHKEEAGLDSYRCCPARPSIPHKEAQLTSGSDGGEGGRGGEIEEAELHGWKGIWLSI